MFCKLRHLWSYDAVHGAGFTIHRRRHRRRKNRRRSYGRTCFVRARRRLCVLRCGHHAYHSCCHTNLPNGARSHRLRRPCNPATRKAWKGLVESPYPPILLCTNLPPSCIRELEDNGLFRRPGDSRQPCGSFDASRGFGHGGDYGLRSCNRFSYFLSHSRKEIRGDGCGLCGKDGRRGPLPGKKEGGGRRGGVGGGVGPGREKRCLSRVVFVITPQIFMCPPPPLSPPPPGFFFQQ